MIQAVLIILFLVFAVVAGLFVLLLLFSALWEFIYTISDSKTDQHELNSKNKDNQMGR